MKPIIIIAALALSGCAATIPPAPQPPLHPVLAPVNLTIPHEVRGGLIVAGPDGQSWGAY